MKSGKDMEKGTAARVRWSVWLDPFFFWRHWRMVRIVEARRMHTKIVGAWDALNKSPIDLEAAKLRVVWAHRQADWFLRPNEKAVPLVTSFPTPLSEHEYLTGLDTQTPNDHHGRPSDLQSRRP